MKDMLRRIFRRPELIYPPLFAAFPILFLYSHNAGEMSATNIVIPIAMSIACTALLMAILSLVLKSASKAALAATIFVVLFFSYGHIYGLLERQNLFTPDHAVLFPGFLLAWGYSVYFVKLAHRDFRTTSTVMCAVAVALIAVNLFSIGTNQVRNAFLAQEDQKGSKQTATATKMKVNNEKMPDIYLFILDEYAHPDTMKEYYNYDNSAFIDYLKGRGFFVAEESTTPFLHTEEVLASVLNMTYLGKRFHWDESGREWRDDIYNRITKFNEDEWNQWMQKIYDKIVNNDVIKSLKASGYKYYYFGNWFEQDRWGGSLKTTADYYYTYNRYSSPAVSSEFIRMIYDTTMLRPFYFIKAAKRYATLNRIGLINAIAKLKEMPDRDSPKFVLVHLICPHEPFVFGPNGESVDPRHEKDYEDRQYYLGQYIFITKQVEMLVDVLQKKSRIKPVIIIQSDHGLRPHFEGIDIGKDEWRKIFYAINLPGADKSVFFDSMSPINTFRFIFNRYFGADFNIIREQDDSGNDGAIK